MIDDDDSYYLDSNGVRALIGLSADETLEFMRLDSAIGVGMPPTGITRDEWIHAEDVRWLELYEKHEAARQPFLNSSKTRH
jgi:hypothetical protein